jgi:hypothetical protein
MLLVAILRKELIDDQEQETGTPSVGWGRAGRDEGEG